MGRFFIPIGVFRVKAGRILQKMNRRGALKRLANPKARNRILDQFNRENLDDVGPLGVDHGMAVLRKMNDLEAGHEEFVKSLAPRVVVP